MDDDLYRVLGVPREADEREIRSAYRALARKYHPDAGDGSSDERFRAVREAYDVLGDPARRRAYDGDRARQGSAIRIEFVRRRPEPRPDHIDLRGFGRGGRAESFGFAGFGAGGYARRAAFDDLEELFRRLDELFFF